MSLPIGTSILILLLLTHHGGVATTTAVPGLTCRQEIPPQLIRELWSQTRLLINKLPREDPWSRHWRLLPRFCVDCQQPIGWPEIKMMIDTYQKSVFSSNTIQKLLPIHYNDLLYRLQQSLKNCVSNATPSNLLKVAEMLEKKIKKRRRRRRRGAGVMKAVAEFTFVLKWTVELMDFF